MRQTALFDFDGVVADTEPLYDIFWGRIGEKYELNIPDFASKIKGTTLDAIFRIYFADCPQDELDKIAQGLLEFEERMEFPEIPGAIGFIRDLKRRGIKVGLVTSSPSSKMKVALKKMNIEGVFDTIVTANRITRGKPDPMCYLLAAEDLAAKPEECVVFEDSFMGIQAGTAAGMRVIGLATTNPAELIRDRVYAVVPDFRDEDLIWEMFG